MCRQFIISGRVQGVFFRDSTRAEANLRGVNGYAQNLPDGTVQVSLCGSDSSLSDMLTWLRVGPTMARVDRVEEELVECTHPVGFEVA